MLSIYLLNEWVSVGSSDRNLLKMDFILWVALVLLSPQLPFFFLYLLFSLLIFPSPFSSMAEVESPEGFGSVFTPYLKPSEFQPSAYSWIIGRKQISLMVSVPGSPGNTVSPDELCSFFLSREPEYIW